ncbi:unnamed protein product [Closterium sp. NIES-65]|nr:unnamed protein product [Closterium sp. NIES-65]
MENLQAWAGIKLELNGEATSGFLSGKFKTRKVRKEMHEIKFKGRTDPRAREVLTVATQFFKESFGGVDDSADSGEPKPLERTMGEANREALKAPWSEEEVRTVVRELAPRMAQGQGGLPKELFEHNWDLLGLSLMQLELTRCKLGIGQRDTGKLTYLGYADDTSLLLRGAEQLSVAAGILEDFGKKSGLKVNRDKTAVLPLEKNRGKPPENWMGCTLSLHR